MQKTAILLGIDQEGLSDKCTDYTEIFVREALKNRADPNREVLVNFIKEKFSYDELVYMSMFWMQDKTEVIYTEYMKDRVNSFKDATGS